MADDFVRRTQLAVLGSGSALPGPPIDTAALLARAARFIPATRLALAKKIAQRLGIQSRHLARDLGAAIEKPRPDATAPLLAAAALVPALQAAQLEANNLAWLFGHTATPHMPLPSNTAWTADELAYSGPYSELRQACTGFATSLALASTMLTTTDRPVAIVGSELGSTFFDAARAADDAQQLVNLVQMGDGAGALLLAPQREERQSRIELVFFGARGLGAAPGLSLPYGGSGAPELPGGRVPHFAHDVDAVRAGGMNLLRAGLDTARAAGYDIDQIDWFIPHQANGRMAKLACEHLALPAERVICDARVLGNLGSAAIWVSFDRLRRSGHLQLGQRVLILGAEATKFLFGGFVYVHGTS